MALRMEVNAGDLKAVLTTLPPVLKAEMQDSLQYAANKFYKKFNPRLRGRPGIMSRPRGIAMRFKKEPIAGESGKGIGIRIYARSRAAVRQEEGGVMQRKDGHKMAVPISDRGEYLMTSIYQGFGRIRARFRMGSGNKRIRPIKADGKIFLAEVKRKRGKDQVTPLFVLKDRVIYPARLGFYSTFEGMRDEIFTMLAQRILRGVKKEWSKGEVSFGI